jgi:exonuclease SbcD
VRFLHTSDWHVGKVLKGRPRHDEHARVLAEIVEVAGREQVDAVLIAGDLYDTSAPTPEAQRLVVHALLRLRAVGGEVLLVAGNHDNAATFDAYRPLMAAAGISVLGQARPPADGGLVTFTARSTGEPARVALLPFVSQRYAVRAAELVARTPMEQALGYDQRVRDMIAALTAGFDDAAVNLVLAHLTVTGGVFGGGERPAQSVFEYHVPATAFPATATYVALGHLHRRQSLPSHCPVHYSGSPISVDFGDQDNAPCVVVGDAAPGLPPRVRDVPLATATPLRTLRGTVADLRRQVAADPELVEAWLRVFVCEPARAGLREEVVTALPNAVDVRIDPEMAKPVHSTVRSARATRTPAQLFADYLATEAVDDARLGTLFDELHDVVTTTPAAE